MKKYLFLPLLFFCIQLSAQTVKWGYDIIGGDLYSISTTKSKDPLIDRFGNSYLLLFINDSLHINNTTIINDKGRCYVLISLDSSGKYKWHYTFKGGNELMIQDIINSYNGGIVLVGGYDGKLELSDGNVLDSFSYFNGFMLKLDLKGKLVWRNNHKNTYGNGFNLSMTGDMDDNIYLCCLLYGIKGYLGDTSSNFPAGLTIAKFDKNGKLLKYTTNFTRTHIGNITASSNGNHIYIYTYIGSGDSIVYGNFVIKDSLLKGGEKDFIVACLNRNLDIMWVNRFPAKSTYAVDYLADKNICVNADENFIFSYPYIGRINLNGKDYSSMQHFLMWVQLDTLGQIKWAFTKNDSNGGQAVNTLNMGITKENNVYASFYSSGSYSIGSINVNKSNTYLNITIDKAGNILKAREFWNIDLFPALKGLATTDEENTFALLFFDSIQCDQQYYGNGLNEKAYVKVGNSTHNINIEPVFISNSVELFPNPNRGLFTIRNLNTNAQKTQFSIFNYWGLKTYTGIWNKESEITMDLSALPKGVYFLQWENKIKRFIIQ